GLNGSQKCRGRRPANAIGRCCVRWRNKVPETETKSVLEIVTAWIRSSAQARFPASEVDTQTNIIETGLLDSVEILYLVGFLEERFGIAVPVEEFVPENFTSARAITELVDRLSRSKKH